LASSDREEVFSARRASSRSMPSSREAALIPPLLPRPPQNCATCAGFSPLRPDQLDPLGDVLVALQRRQLGPV
jgi:hypothetical protein